MIDKRARSAGELISLEKSIKLHAQKIATLMGIVDSALEQARGNMASIHQLQSRIETTRKKIDAINVTLSMHEIQIDPSSISPIRLTQRAPGKHGELTRNIIAVLHDAGGEPVTTKTLAEHVAIRMDVQLTPENDAAFRLRIHYRLKNLRRDKRLIQIERGRWLLATYLVETDAVEVQI